MCKLVRKLTTVLLAVVFAVNIGFVIHQFTQYDQAEESHLQAQELAVRPETAAPTRELPEVTVPLSTAPQPDETVKAMLALDIAALQAVNADVLGWIRIPDTKIDYPLMGADNNTEYLHTAWDDSYNYAGSKEGMVTMDGSILELYRKGTITRDVALEYADNPDQMLRRIEL